MLRAALRRFLKLFAGSVAFTAVVSVVLGFLFGGSLARSLTIGFYLAGSFLIVIGFFLGNRGPVRQKDERGTLLFGPRYVRWATPDEREEALSSSAVFVVLGFALIVIGVLADTKHSLF